MDEALERQIEEQIRTLGYGLVDLESAGSKTRPILRIRIERQEGAADSAITLEDCTRVSRAVEAFLDEREAVGERYVLEVSSPGVERPLVKRQDFERFAGKEVAIKSSQPIADLGKRVEGILRGVNADDVVQLEVGGRTVDVPRGEIRKAHLVYRWDQEKK